MPISHVSRSSALRVALVAVPVAVASMLGCGGGRAQVGSANPAAVVSAQPKWYPAPPRKDGFLVASASAESPDLHVGMSRARMRARTEIAQALEVRLQGLQKSFSEQTGAGSDGRVLDQFTEVTRTVVSDVLNGSEVTDSKVLATKSGYVVFALVQMPIGEANRAFMMHARARDELWTQLRSSKAFQELDAEIRKLDSTRVKQP